MAETTLAVTTTDLITDQIVDAMIHLRLKTVTDLIVPMDGQIHLRIIQDTKVRDEIGPVHRMFIHKEITTAATNLHDQLTRLM